MRNLRSSRLGRSALAAALFLTLRPAPAAAFDLFARHEVTVEFATTGGKPMADAEVQVFAPGKPDQPALVGRTDGQGKFEFSANEDGFWSAEAHSAGEIARVMVRVGGTGWQKKLSPFWLIGGLLVLLILAFADRVARARARRPRPG